jgi:hypothetical protein
MLRFIATLTTAVFLLGTAHGGGVAEAQSAPAPAGQTNGGHGPLIVPAGTPVSLVVTRPIKAKSAKANDPLYAQTSYPVAIGGRMAIPAGTFVQGQILSLTRPTRKVNSSVLQVRFTKLVYANGYTVALAEGAQAGDDTMEVTVQVSTANDLLLDNGAQMDLTLTSPLKLSGKSVRAAIALSRPPAPGSLASATLCRPTPGAPGTPGTPDTVIPGTPGTPDTVIPGVDGAPDTVIPGIPSTPDTVIPGTPGTPDIPGTVCPAAPRVISSVPMAAMPAPSQTVSAN